MMLEKSSRRQKIIGVFGDNLICNFLSRSGFEVSINHTGLDLFAYNHSSCVISSSEAISFRGVDLHSQVFEFLAEPSDRPS